MFDADNQRLLFDWSLLAMTALSNFAQIFVIWLIFCETPNSIREYSAYLLGITVKQKKIYITYN